MRAVSMLLTWRLMWGPNGKDRPRRSGTPNVAESCQDLSMSKPA